MRQRAWLRSYARFTLALTFALPVVFFLNNCGGPGNQTTRMTTEDFQEMAAQMSQSLAMDDNFRNRTAQSEPWVISIDKTQNLSSDVITESERRYVVQKMRSSLPIRTMGEQKNVKFVIPAEQLQRMRNDPRLDVKDDPNFQRTTPTHQMTATFRTVTRADATNRTDLYYCEFHLYNLKTGEQDWTDKFEYKRAAAGHIWD